MLQMKANNHEDSLPRHLDHRGEGKDLFRDFRFRALGFRVRFGDILPILPPFVQLLTNCCKLL